jgi:chromosome segregation ATPase
MTKFESLKALVAKLTGRASAHPGAAVKDGKAADPEIASMQTELKDISAQIESLEQKSTADLADANKTIADLRNEVATEKTNVENANKKATELQGTIDSMKTDMEKNITAQAAVKAREICQAQGIPVPLAIQPEGTNPGNPAAKGGTENLTGLAKVKASIAAQISGHK